MTFETMAHVSAKKDKKNGAKAKESADEEEALNVESVDEKEEEKDDEDDEEAEDVYVVMCLPAVGQALTLLATQLRRSSPTASTLMAPFSSILSGRDMRRWPIAPGSQRITLSKTGPCTRPDAFTKYYIAPLRSWSRSTLILSAVVRRSWPAGARRLPPSVAANPTSLQLPPRRPRPRRSPSPAASLQSRTRRSSPHQVDPGRMKSRPLTPPRELRDRFRSISPGETDRKPSTHWRRATSAAHRRCLSSSSPTCTYLSPLRNSRCPRLTVPSVMTSPEKLAEK